MNAWQFFGAVKPKKESKRLNAGYFQLLIRYMARLLIYIQGDFYNINLLLK